MNDGRIQVSFTLPVPDGERAVEAAREIMFSMGLTDPVIAWHESLDEGSRSLSLTDRTKRESIIRRSKFKRSMRAS